MSGYSNDNGKKIFVRVRYNHVNKYVFLDQLCAENFLDEGEFDRHDSVSARYFVNLV